MAIRLGGKKITSMYLGGKKVKEVWLKGEKVWPEDSGPGSLGARLYYPLNGDATEKVSNANAIIVGSTNCWQAGGPDGRMYFYPMLPDSPTVLQLNDLAKIVGPFTISVLINPGGTSGTTRNGLMGGVISGNNSIGLGYAVAARVNGDLSRGFQFQQYPANRVSPNVDGSYCISQDQWQQTINKKAWMHLLLVFDSDPTKRAMYLNGYKYSTHSSTAQVGNVNYDSRDRGWDGHIYLGRCFQTITTPYDYFTGQIQDLWIWDRALTEEERKVVTNYYVGNLIVARNTSMKIADLKKNGVFICTSGTGDFETTWFFSDSSAITPSGEKATTIEVDITGKSPTDLLKFYINRSIDTSIRGGGITGYYLKVNDIEYIHTMGNIGRLTYNRDGSATVIGIPVSAFKLGSNTIKAFLPGFDSEQVITVNCITTVQTFNFRIRFVWAGSASPTPIIPNYALRVAGSFRAGGDELIVQSTPLANIIGNEIILSDIPDLADMLWVFDLTNSIQYPLAGSVTVHRPWATGWPLLFLINNTGSNTTFANGAESENTIAWENLTESDGKTIILYVNLCSLTQDSSLFQAMRNSSQEDGFRQI